MRLFFHLQRAAVRPRGDTTDRSRVQRLIMVWIGGRGINTIVTVWESKGAGSGSSSVSAALCFKVTPWAEGAIWRSRSPTPFAPRLCAGKAATSGSVTGDTAAEARAAIRPRIVIVCDLKELLRDLGEET